MDRRLEARWPLRIGVLTVAGCVITIAVIGYAWWVPKRPPSISGDWLLTDLRTPGSRNMPVTFSPTGVLEADPAFESRWKMVDGRIVVHGWRSDGDSWFSWLLADTVVYPWFVDRQEFTLVPEFGRDGTSMTLAFPGQEPHALLHRAANATSDARRTTPRTKSP